MKNAVDARDRRGEPLRVRSVGLKKLDAITHRPPGFDSWPVLKIIKHPHPIASFDQSVRDVRADESRAARDQNRAV